MERLNLGELIDLLKTQPQNEMCWFNFGGVSPTTCASYRGYYGDVALGFDLEADPKVKDVIMELEKAVGAMYTGWKGGDFVMSRESQLWVANPGYTGGTVIVGLEDCDYMTILKTAWMDH